MPEAFLSGRVARFLRDLVGWSRPAKQACMVACDVGLLSFSAWLALSIRWPESPAPSLAQGVFILAAPLLAVPVFVRIGLYRSVIRYLGEQALWAVFKAMALASILWAALAFMTETTGHHGIPRAAPVVYGAFGLILVTGVRFAARWVLWLPIRRRFVEGQVLIYGAGGSGRQLAASLRAGRGLFPAGFIDDDPSLAGTDVDGWRVYLPTDLESLIDRFDIKEVIVCLPSSSSARRREILNFLEKHLVRVRILPALSEIASGRHLVSMIREVDVGDLLGRDPVMPDPSLLGATIRGKVVLVTGAGGSIGSELCRQIVTLGPRRLILVDASESALYEIDRRMPRLPGVEIRASLGTVEDQAFVQRLLEAECVDTVYHAAAHKHVPLVELNPLEGVANNILGTWVLVEACLLSAIQTFVLISTDKAVRPTNIMGATKRWAELLVQDAAERAAKAGSGARFCAVRFGNVLGSSGSVIPLFREQIAAGGPVTVTHPGVSRYFMSIHEAVELVIQAGSLARGGEVFLLDMGEPVRIADLARNMIRLAGREVRDESHPDGDIEIEYIGLRPGEKLFEELLIGADNAAGTRHPKIMRAREPVLDSAELLQRLERMRHLLDQADESALRALIMEGANGTEAIPRLRRVV